MIETMWLFVAGGFLLLCELFVFSYFLLFIGIGVVLTGVLNFLGLFGSLATQLVSIVLCSMLALLVLKPLLKRFSKPSEKFVENANLKLKIGSKALVVENGVIECNGTMWQCDTTGFEVGQRVKIADFKEGVPFIVAVK